MPVVSCSSKGILYKYVNIKKCTKSEAKDRETGSSLAKELFLIVNSKGSTRKPKK